MDEGTCGRVDLLDVIVETLSVFHLEISALNAAAPSNTAHTTRMYKAKDTKIGGKGMIQKNKTEINQRQ